MATEEILEIYLGELCSFFDRPPLVGLALKVWTQRLIELSDKELIHAVETALATLNKFPSCENLIQFVKGSRPLEQWVKIDQARQKINPNPSTVDEHKKLFDEMDLDYSASKALDYMGGLPALAVVPDEQLNWTRKEFISCYDTFENCAQADRQEYERQKVLKAACFEPLALPSAATPVFVPENIKRLAELVRNVGKKMPEPEPVVVGADYRAIASEMVHTQKYDEENF